MKWPWQAAQATDAPFDPAQCPGIPPPLDEHPPADRYCDLVLNGGVASGVVYPWALVRLAGRYRFRNIGGNSVGAIAAAVAAAGEYGRCHGVARSFEALRRMPMDLAEEDSERRAGMLRLFQPRATVARLFAVFLDAASRYAGAPANDTPAGNHRASGVWLLASVARVYQLRLPLAIWMLLSAATLARLHSQSGWQTLPLLAAAVALVAIGLLAVALLGYCRISADLRALTDNDYGLCPGSSQDARSEALLDWLHRGVQLSAGRSEADAPLTFAELWSAPRGGQPGPQPRADGGPPEAPGIGLAMFTSNITQGKPIRLPLDEPGYRLYYRREEWARIFPPAIMAALDAIAVAYTPQSASDPTVDTTVRVGPVVAGQYTEVAAGELREVPRAQLPIVVAARLSLCFPLLFSLVPVYAVDYEAVRGARALRRCLLADGGLCSNFPVHLFDSAQPRWPTFDLLLDQRLQAFESEPVWLPVTHLAGRADNWQRSVPGAEQADASDGRYRDRGIADRLAGIVLGMVLTMKDWNDRVAARLPTLRNRVVRIALKQGEGQLNIAMSGATIMRMANEYGNQAAEKIFGQFDRPTPLGGNGWAEHRYVRAVTELRALRRHLKHYTQAVNSCSEGETVRDIIAKATAQRPLAADARGFADAAGGCLQPAERDALLRAIDAVCALEGELARCERNFGPYHPEPMPELRLRPPV